MLNIINWFPVAGSNLVHGTGLIIDLWKFSKARKEKVKKKFGCFPLVANENV